MTVRDDIQLDDDVAGVLDHVAGREVYQFSGVEGQTVQIRLDVWGAATDLSYAAGRLSTVGGTEDGYNAIDVALELLDFRESASKHVILVTDEDRDSFNQSLSLSGLEADLQAQAITLHAIVNTEIDTTNQSEDALGIDGDATDSSAYFADGSGGYTSAASGGVTFTSYGTTDDDYIDPTFELGGTVWDLNQLRSGGAQGTSFATALSFSQAFVAILTEQIIDDFEYDLVASDPEITFEILSETLTEDDVSYDVRFTGDGEMYVFDLEFVREDEPSVVFGSIPVTITTHYVRLTEDSDFNTAYTDTFTVDENTAAVSIKFSDLGFDTTDTAGINDAFELALVDENGDPLVGTILAGRDAFFNITEGEAAELGGGVDYDVAAGIVTVDVTHVASGTEATLIARLVNNDTDTTTTVVIAPVATLLSTSPVADPSTTTPQESAGQPQTIDFDRLTDVSAGMTADYRQTSFQERDERLFAAVEITNGGTFAVRGPLLVGVRNIDEPLVLVSGHDGVAPDGTPYYDVTHLMDDETFDPEETLSGLVLKFYNPDQLQFSYELAVLGHLNDAPEFVSEPLLEVVAGNAYAYDADATDPDGDTLTYSLVSGPDDLSIDAETGEVTWTTDAADIGFHPVVIRVEDAYGGSDEQLYTLAVVGDVPNRPPVFTSVPVVDAFINITYAYQATAFDADGDDLTFSVVSGPTGLQIEDSDIGLVTWDPTDDLVDQLVSVTLKVEDGNGGEAEQDYLIYVHRELGNHNPIIISEPNVTFELAAPSSGNPALGDVSPTQLNLSLSAGEESVQTVTLDFSSESDWLTADVVIVVDQTGSMEEEHDWIPGLIASLNTNLEAAGITENRFALIGYRDDTYIYTLSPEPFYVSFYDPTGSLVSSVWIPDRGDATAILDDFTLPADGNYLVVAESDGFFDGVYYGFAVEAVSSVVTSLALRTNEVTRGLIRNYGETFEYSFELDDTSRLLFESLTVATDEVNYRWRLSGPDGDLVVARTFAAGPKMIDAPAGEYTLTVVGDPLQIGTFEFRLLDLTSSARPMTPGIAVGDILDPASSSHIYQFDASAGDSFYFDAEQWTGSDSGRWRLLDPYGDTVFDESLNEDAGSVTLWLNGSYTLLVDGDPDDPAAARGYALNAQPEAVNTATLSTNTLVSDSIDAAGERFEYDLTVSTGGLFLFDSLSDTADVNWSLSGAEGSVVDQRTFDQSDLLLELYAGGYTLTVDAPDDLTGGFDFQLLDLSTAAAALTLDSQEVATLSPGNSAEVYSFDVDAGDILTFDAQGWTGNGTATWRLLDPYGNTIFDDVATNDQSSLTLQADGSYTLLIHGDVAESAGSPAFTFQVDTVGSDPPDTPTGTSISIGQTISDSLGSGETDNYVFTLTADALLYFDVLTKHTSSGSTESEEVAWTLFGPAGTAIDERYFRDSDGSNIDDDNVLLDLPAGDYQLTIDDTEDEETDYSFRLLDLAEDAAAISPGTAVSGTFANSRQTEIFEFTASAGDRFYFDAQTWTGQVQSRWRLVDPFGNVVFNEAANTDHDTLTLTADGDYRLLLEGDMLGSGSSADYQFNVEPEALTTTAIGQLDAVYETSSSITAFNERHVYTFSLPDDTRLYFDALSGPNNIDWSLSGPAGDLVVGQSFDQSDRAIFAAAAGSYTLTVDAAGTATGDYDFRLIDLDAHATAYTVGTLVSTDLDPAQGTDVYLFSANAGDRLRFDSFGGSGSALTRWKVLDPLGHSVMQVSFISGLGPISMPMTGEYKLLIEGSVSDAAESRSYQFRIDPAEVETTSTSTTTSHTLSLNTTTSETIEESGDRHEYALSLDDSAWIYFDTLTNDADILWTLNGPQGELVATRGFDEADLFVGILPAAEYTLIVEGDGATTGDFSFRLLDLTSAAQSLTPGNPESGSLDPAQETNVYAFQASADDVFDFEAPTESVAAGALWRLLSPSGSVVFSDGLDTDQTDVTLSMTGTYTLLVEGDVADTESDRDYTINAELQETVSSYSLNGTEIDLNETVSGEIEESEVVEYNFTLTETTLVYMDTLHRVTSSEETVWGLEGEGGTIVSDRAFGESDAADADDEDVVMVLPAGGYNLTIENEEDDDDFEFRVLGLAAFATSFTPDTPQTNKTLNPSRETDVYSFTASAGDTYDFDSLTSSAHFQARWRLVDSSGAVLFTNALTADLSGVELSESGTYYVLIEGGPKDSATSQTYGFDVQFVSNDPPPPPPSGPPVTIDLGESVSGAISTSGETDEYEFTLSATTLVYFDSLSDDSQLTWTLTDSSETTIDSRTFAASDGNNIDDEDLLLSLTADTYTLTIEGDSGATGDYAFQLLDVENGGATLAVGTATIQTLSPASETDVYHFTAASGDELYYGVLAWNGSADARLRLIDPSGAVVLHDSITADQDQFELQSSGTFTLLVEGDVSDSASARLYKFQVDIESFASSQALTLDQTVNGSVASAEDRHRYTFTGTAGQHLYLDWISAGSADFRAELWDADRNVLMTSNYDSAELPDSLGVITLSDSADYTLVISADNSATGSFSFQLLDMAGYPELEIDASTTGVFATVDEEDLFHFSGQAGDRLIIRLDAWGTAYQAGQLAGQNLNPIGEDEEGYLALNAAVATLGFRENAARQVVLVTDDDRDIVSPDEDLNFETMLARMEDFGVTLHAALKMQSVTTPEGDLLGVDGLQSGDISYLHDENGGYITGNAGEVTFVPDVNGDDNATTQEDYVDLALASGGSVWDVNRLRNGGFEADAFTKALVSFMTTQTLEDLEVDLVPSDPEIQFTILDEQSDETSVTYDIRLTGDGRSHSFDLQFVREDHPGILLGSIPVTIQTEYAYDVDAIDPDDDPITFELIGETHGAAFDDETGLLEWVPADFGEYEFTARVSDGRGGFDLQTWTVTVTPPGGNNTDPVIQPISPITIDAGRSVVFAMTATDADNDVLTWQLVDDQEGGHPLPAGIAIDPQSGQISWTPTAGQIGAHTLVVRVRDTHGGIDTATVDVTVEPASGFENARPQITSTPPTAAYAGRLYRYDVVAVDSDLDPLTFNLSLRTEGMAIDPQTGSVAWMPTDDDVGTHDIIVRVRDGQGGIALQAYEIEVSLPGDGPVFTSTPTTVTNVNTQYSYQPTVDDPDPGETLTFALVESESGPAIDPDTGLLTWTPTSVGVTTVTLSVTDSTGQSAVQTFDLAVVDPAVNNAPVINTTPRSVVQATQTFIARFTADDSDGDTLSWSLVSGPTGMEITADGLLTWSTTADDVNDPLTPHQYTVRVDDGRGEFAEDNFSLDVVLQSANSAPVIESTPGGTAVFGSEFVYDASATDADSDLLIWTLELGSDGMQIDPLSGRFTWTPDPGQLGEHTVRVRVSDPYGGSDTQSFSINARGANRPPLIESVPPTEVFIGDDYNYQVAASDPDREALTYSLVNPPTGMTIDDETGLIEWTPGTADTYTITLQVFDPHGDGVEQTYDLEVLASTTNRPPRFTSIPGFFAELEQTYQYQVAAVDPNDDTLTYGLASYPTGMTINTSSGLIEWTPGSGDAGYYVVTVTVSDGQYTPFQSYLMLARQNDPPVIAPISDMQISAGANFRFNVFAGDPDFDPLFYALTDAPSGMSIDQFGRIVWQTDVADIATHSVEVTVTDYFGAESTESFDLTVTADTTDPVVAILASANPAVLDTDVTILVRATDDVGVELLELTVDGTPVVLDSSGAATITVDSLTTRALVATATDLAGNTGTANLNLTVIDPSDVNQPVVALTAPEANDFLTEPTDVVGSVDDPDDNLVSWTLTLTPVQSGSTLPSNSLVVAAGTTELTDATLGQIDTTLLANGLYRLTLAAVDVGGNTASTSRLVSIDGRLKLGNFNVSFVDLQVPVAGIPITVTRTYDTLKSSQSGDFGYGWTLDLSDTRIQVDHPNSGLSGFGNYIPFRDGTRVLITLPDGTTEGFTFYGEPGTQVLGIVLDWLPTFVPDAGVRSELLVDQVSLRKVGDEYVDIATGLAYNPARWEFGNTYTLVTRSGVELAISADTGRLSTVTDRNGNTLFYSEYGIFSDTGRTIQFQRDYSGRITSIVDPAGYSIGYQYDSAGNLIAVTDRMGVTTQFTYLSDPAHYLDDIVNPLGVTAARTEYDANGRVSKLIDADGQTIEYSYDLGSTTQTITDQLDNETTITLDPRGNVLREEVPLGGIITRTYDADDNLLSETIVIGQEDDPQNGETNDLTTTHTYNAAGDLLTTTDPAGNTSYFTYTSYGAPLTSTDQLGNTTRNTFDSKGNLTAVVDQHGSRTSFAYDSSGNLTRLTDPLGKNTFMTYNAYGEVVQSTDPLGNQTTFAYDVLGQQIGTSFDWTNPLDSQDVRTVATTTEFDHEGRVTRTVDPNGNEQLTEYNALGQVISTTDVLGHETTSRFDGRGRLIETVYTDGTLTRTVYDAKGRAVYRVDPHLPGESANGTQTIYDAADRVVETRRLEDVVIDIVDSSGVLSAELDSAGSILSTTTSSYDNAGRLTSSTQTQAGETLSSTSYEYDGLGRQVAYERTIGSTTLRTEYEYDSFGRTVAVIDPYDRETRYLYDSFGRQTTTVHHTGAQSETTYDSRGRVVSTTSFEGVVTEYEYDGFGRQSAMEETAGGITRRTEYEYNIYGNQTLIRDALGRETTLTYDEHGRTVATTYDDASETAMTYDDFGRVVAETDAMGLTREYEYDDFGRLAAVILPAVTHPVTSQTVRPRYEYEYDEKGNQTIIRDNVVELTDGTVLYDHDGNSGDDVRETTLTYDDFGRRTSRTLPEGQTETFEYDDYGRMVRHTDFQGRVVDSVFSDLGFLEELDYFASGADPDADPPDETTGFLYDDLGRRIGVTDDRGDTDFTYDDDGRTIQIDLPEGVINYEYDELTGRLTRTFVSDPSDPSDPLHDVEYGYDAFGRLAAVSVVERNDVTLSTPEVTTYAYDLVGNLVRVDLPNGIVTEYVYDDLNRLDVMTHYEPDGTPADLSDNDKIARYDYDVRADGRRTAVTETVWESGSPLVTTIDWSYDNLGRLVEEVYDSHDDNLDFTATYSFDLVGNRLEKTVDQGSDSSVDETITYTYDENDRLLTEVKDLASGTDTTTTYEYGGPTNPGTEQTKKTVTDTATSALIQTVESTYNLQGRLSEVVVDTYDSGDVVKRETTSYEYDESGLRVASTNKVKVDDDADPQTPLVVESETETTYLNDPNNPTGYSQTIEEITRDTATQAVTRNLVFTLGHDVIAQTEIDPAQAGSEAGDPLFLLYDGHGSTRFLAALDAAIQQGYSYDAYGNPVGFDPAAAMTALLYSGEAFDPRINQQYLRARWYDAHTGRFNRLDPFFGNLRGPQSLHKYLYTHADPVNGIDPTGQFSTKTVVAGIAVATALVGVGLVLRHPSGASNTNLFPIVDTSKVEVHLHSVRVMNPDISADELFLRMQTLQDIAFVKAYPTTEDLRSVNQVIWFDMEDWITELGQGDFAVRITKLDVDRRFFVVRTVKGHPLAGWRAWQVDELPNGDLTIRTFSVEHPVTFVDGIKLQMGGLSGMYEVWDALLKNLAAFSGGEIDFASADTLLEANERHQQEDVEEYLEFVE